MLPSTGYFKAIYCPFYENGLCERPYCHFRHVKREAQNISNENGTTLQKLIAETVKKVLQHSDVASSSHTQQILKPDELLCNASRCVQTTVSKAIYNPTPISELNKINNETDNNEETAEQKRRHIPVPYTPQKPASLPLKRPIETNGSTKPFIFIPPKVQYTPGSTDNVTIDPYLPKGSVESVDKYHPGSETKLQAYTPVEVNISNKMNYVPSDKSDEIKKKLLEYKPTKVSSKTETPKVTYQPTPLSQVPCFSSDEEEPDTKKKKLSKDLNNFDGLESEFQILDQILDEEKPNNVRSKEYIVTDNHSNKEGNAEQSLMLNTKEKDMQIVSDNKTERKEKSSSSKDKHKKKIKNSDKDNRNHSKNSNHKNQKHKSRSKEKDRYKHSSEKSSKSCEDKSSTTHKSGSSRNSISSLKKLSHRKSENKDEKKRDKHDEKRHKSKKDKQDSHERFKKQIGEPLNNTDNNNQSETLDVEELIDDISDSDEETIALECKKIFEEYVPTVKTKENESFVKKNDIEEEYIPTKKRISRTDKSTKILSQTPIKPDFKVNAALTMAERHNKIKEYHTKRQTIQSKIKSDAMLTLETQKNNNSNMVNSKIRIAHVPYASTLINAKKSIPTNLVVKNDPSTSKTITQTLKKGAQRVAHIPNEKFIDRPGVLEPLASKIPANIRSTYLNKMIDECLKIYLSATDAYARAQQEELNTSKKCSTVQIYKNSAVLTVNRLRKEIIECNGVKKSGSDYTILEKVPNTQSGVYAGSWSIENKNKKSNDNVQEYLGAKFYKNICKWILTEEQLHDNSFPRAHVSGEKGRAQIDVQNNKQKSPKGNIRTCCRCKKDYVVDKKGLPVIQEECIYHPNNKYRFRGEVRYQCCSQDGTSDGCSIAPNHVFEYVNYENLRGYVRTLPPERLTDDYGVYALDCEMCYTTHGLDLTRITVINASCKVVYETLIKPLHPIIDYNTRYSGITEEHMADVNTTLLEVQATLLSMFNSKTILIGHSLESDFKALKLIHDTVIDTSVLFPHKMGPPYKRALRNLSSEYLKKIIQNSVDGHDSAEDATVCMELIHYKLREELKTR